MNETKTALELSTETLNSCKLSYDNSAKILSKCKAEISKTPATKKVELGKLKKTESELIEQFKIEFHALKIAKAEHEKQLSLVKETQTSEQKQVENKKQIDRLNELAGKTNLVSLPNWVKYYDDFQNACIANLELVDLLTSENENDIEMIKTFFKRIEISSFTNEEIKNLLVNFKRELESGDSTKEPYQLASDKLSKMTSDELNTISPVLELAVELLKMSPVKSQRSKSTGEVSTNLKKHPSTWKQGSNKALLYSFLQESGTYSYKELETKFDNAKTGTTTFNDQYNMVKRMFNHSGYGQLTKNGDVVTLSLG